MASRRLFVSVDLSDELCEEIETVQEPFGAIPGVRAVSPDGLHVTLKFLGTVESNRVDDVSAMLAEAVATSAVDPFLARIGGLGVFPDFEYISVIWLGVRAGGSELAQLHRSIERRFVEDGFEPEDHEFTPHVTIARMDHGGGKERVQELLQAEDPSVGEMRVEEVRLTESTMAGEGSGYETVARVPL